PTEDQAGRSQGDSHNAILAERALVPYNQAHVSQRTSTGAKEQSLTSIRKQPTHPREEPDVVSDGLEHRRHQAIVSGANDSVLKIMFDSEGVKNRLENRAQPQRIFIQ
ncbi:hypothetical protein BGZ58_003217, partial [Dissophora ornata]